MVIHAIKFVFMIAFEVEFESVDNHVDKFSGDGDLTILPHEEMFKDIPQLNLGQLYKFRPQDARNNITAQFDVATFPCKEKF
ncbi:hypothetical protein K4K58_002379 [Colletotrichum sp. SAR11_239]|nr:hypothetical protein K4K58_002379 [Colletotrichum sp. SAR11_239]